MGWREDRLPASFKGVPFEIDSDSQPAGQRVQIHEYPQRDKPFVESLGKKTNEIKVVGFVSGQDCLDKRDQLLDVINEPGAGELIHPWLGSLNVSVTECTYSHSRVTMGMVRFELTFVENESEPDYPVAGQDAAALLNSAADDLKDSAVDRFLEALDSIDLTQVNLEAILEPIGQVLETIEGAYDAVDSVFSKVESIYNDVVAEPLAFANTVFSAINSGVSMFEGFYSRAKSVVSLFDISDKLSALAFLKDTLLPKGNANKVFVSVVRDLVQDAIATDVLRSIAVLPNKQLAKPATGAVAVDNILPASISQTVQDSDRLVGSMLGGVGQNVPVADDVLKIRDQVSSEFWALAESSPADHYGSISAARALATKRLVNVAKQGVVLASYENRSVTPALVLSYRQYGDAGKTADIVARNNVKHPGFLPVDSLRIPRS